MCARRYRYTSPYLSNHYFGILTSDIHSQDVSGGPFGIEPSIRAAGNFYAIIGEFGADLR